MAASLLGGSARGVAVDSIAGGSGASPLQSAALTSMLNNFASGTAMVEADLGTLQGSQRDGQEFDYVVVGGGTAGNVVAVRLAEAGARVALIEAGGFMEILKPVLSTTPAAAFIGVGWDIRDSIGTVDWKFVTEPQAGAADRKMHYARGKCLGGSSALNFMLYHRGTRGSFDRWAELVGDDSFRFQKLDTYFKRSVTFTPPDTKKRLTNATTPYNASDFAPAGRGGPIQVDYTNYVSPWSTWLERGLKSAGLKREQGFNSGSLMGYHYAQTTIRQSAATRSSSAEYIYHARNWRRRNLKLFLRSHATKILFSTDRKAEGVEFRRGLRTIRLRATKEVILSAGAFQSPQLLMVSGIGPVDTLRRFGILILSALPGVGQNMWDHVFFGPSYAVNVPTLDDFLIHPLKIVTALGQYVLNQAGAFSSNIVELLGWENIPKAFRSRFSARTEKQLTEFPRDWPDLEYLVINGHGGDLRWPLLQQPVDGRNYASFLSAFLKPESRGNVTIRSASALDAPLINPNWMTAKADQEVAVAAYRRMRDLWKMPGLRPVLNGKEYFPGESKASTDEEILQVVRESLMTVWHAACTCKMGKKGNEMAVVDHRARVFGVKGLRVVDASAMPIFILGHPQSTVYMLAEKIADDILRSGSDLKLRANETGRSDAGD